MRQNCLNSVTAPCCNLFPHPWIATQSYPSLVKPLADSIGFLRTALGRLFLQSITLI